MAQYLATWDCTLCNFTNSSYKESCEMCDAPRSYNNSNDALQNRFNQSVSLQNNGNNLNQTEIVKPIYLNYRDQIQPSYNNSIVNNDNSNNIHHPQSIHQQIPNNDDNSNQVENINKDQWQCKQCTFINHIDLLYCEVCTVRQPTVQRDTSNNKLYKQQQHQHQQPSQAQKQSYINNDKHNVYNQNNIFQSKPKSDDSMRPNNQYQPSLNVNTWNDSYVAQQIQNEEAQRMKEFYDDLEAAKQLQQQLEFEANMDIAQQMQAEEAQKMQQFYDGVEVAKQLEQKYQADEVQFVNDRQIALKMQKEFAEGLAWFCASCFTMNLNIQSFDCEVCGTKRPKPKIPDVLTVRDQVCMKMIDMLRDAGKQQNINCIVNLALAQNFVTKYLKMCKQRGLQIARPQIVYHWTRQQFFDPIKKQGLKVPDGKKVKHMTDTGWYGRGIYMSPDPKYAQGYGYGAKLFFAALSLPGNMFSAKYPRDLGIGLKDGYDSHFSSDRVNAQTNVANEWVFFKPEQLLLCFHITLDQVQYITPVLNQVINYLVSKYDTLSKKGGIKGL